MQENWKASKEEINKVLSMIQQGKKTKELPKISQEAAAEIAKHIRQLLRKELH